MAYVVDCFVNINGKVKCKKSIKRANKDESILYGSARGLRRLLSVASIFFINIWFNIFNTEAVAYGVDVECKLPFIPNWSKIAHLQHEEGELTIVFKLPSNGYYYIALTAHAFQEYVYEWIGLVIDCYIFYAFTLNGRLTTFNLGPPLEKVNESGEEIHNDPSGKELFKKAKLKMQTAHVESYRKISLKTRMIRILNLLLYSQSQVQPTRLLPARNNSVTSKEDTKLDTCSTTVYALDDE